MTLTATGAGGDGGVFELGGEGVAAGSGEGDVDLVGAFGVLLDDDVGGDVDVVGVVAGSADQDCRCRPADQGVVAGEAGEGVVAGQAIDAVVAGGAGPVVAERVDDV
jgi:hypothetical protein